MIGEPGKKYVTVCCGKPPVPRYMDTPGCPGCNQWSIEVEPADNGEQSDARQE